MGILGMIKKLSKFWHDIGKHLIIPIIIFSILFWLLFWVFEAGKQEIEKQHTFKYAITTTRQTYYANEYSYTNGILTIVDGYTSNTITLFQQPTAIRQQH